MPLSFSNTYGSIEIHERGASLHQFSFDGVKIVPGLVSELQRFIWKSGSILFPFPGRLVKREMHYKGGRFLWPKNDLSTQSAIHGFTPDYNFELKLVKNGIQAHLHYHGDLPHYPFPFLLIVHYTIEEWGLNMEVMVKNMSDEHMPYHLGWHPYINLKENWRLESRFEGQFHTNHRKSLEKFDKFLPFNWNGEIDAGYKFDGHLDLFTNNLKIRLVTDSPWVQLFKPHNARVMAVEPMTGLGHPTTPWLELGPYEDRVHKWGFLITRT